MVEYYIQGNKERLIWRNSHVLSDSAWNGFCLPRASWGFTIVRRISWKQFRILYIKTRNKCSKKAIPFCRTWPELVNISRSREDMKTNKSASFNTIPVFTLQVLNEKLFSPKLRIVGLWGPEILPGNLKFSVGPQTSICRTIVLILFTFRWSELCTMGALF